jgi:hypothetical protein
VLLFTAVHPMITAQWNRYDHVETEREIENSTLIYITHMRNFPHSYYRVQDETTYKITLPLNQAGQSMDVKSLAYLWLSFYSLSGDICTVTLENCASYIRQYVQLVTKYLLWLYFNNPLDFNICNLQ